MKSFFNKINLTPLIAIFIGNILEFFDFMLFAHLAPIIGKKYFPPQETGMEYLYGLGLFAVGFLARPLGAIYFGIISDKKNRQVALIKSMALMTLPTLMIAILPTYQQIGMIAPLCLILCRLIQGFAVGGEYSNAGIYLMETYPDQQFKFSSYFSATCQLGSLLALAVSYIIIKSPEYEQLWRLPFLTGFLLGLIGVYLRYKLNLSNKINPHASLISFPKVIATNYKYILLFTIYTGLTIGLLWIGINFSNMYAVKWLNKDFSELFINNAISIIFYIFTAIFIAQFRISNIKKYIMINLGILIVAILPSFYYLTQGKILQFQIILNIFGATLGGFIHFMGCQIFSKEVRSRCFSLGYTLGVSLISSTSPFIATFLINKSGYHIAPGIYILLISITLLTIVSKINLFQSAK